MRVLPLRLVALLVSAGAWASAPAQPIKLSIDGPCGQVHEGDPGSLWDDGTGGADYFFDTDVWSEEFREDPNDRPGNTWDVLLTTDPAGSGTFDCTDPEHHCCRWCCGQRGYECVFDGDELVEQTVYLDEFNTPPSGAQGWSWGIGVEGALSIVDITTSGTVSCAGGRFPRSPECLSLGGFELVELTGPPLRLPDGRVIDRAGPDVPENTGAISAIVLGRYATLPPLGSSVVAKLRVLARFPAEGVTAAGRLFFTPRTGSGQEIRIIVTIAGRTLTASSEECEVRFRAVDLVADFVRCDVNADGRSDITDAVRMFRTFFDGGPPIRCRGAADCDADGAVGVTDVIYGLSYQFTGGPPPPPPFPECGGRDGLTAEDCPRGSTGCP